MTVRRTKRIPKIELDEEVFSSQDVQIDNVIESLQFSRMTSSFAEIYLALETQFGMTRQQAKDRFVRYKQRRKERVAEAVGDPSNRGEAILRLRGVGGRMYRRRAQAEFEEQQAKREKKAFTPSRLTPSYGEILKFEDLLADLEGTRAPTKQFVVTADVSKAKLDLLGVQSPDEIAAVIAHGKKLLEKKGFKGRRVVEAHGEEPTR